MLHQDTGRSERRCDKQLPAVALHSVQRHLTDTRLVAVAASESSTSMSSHACTSASPPPLSSSRPLSANMSAVTGCGWQKSIIKPKN